VGNPENAEPPLTPSEKGKTRGSRAGSGALDNPNEAPPDATLCDAQLGRLARLWPSLPGDVREAVMVIVGRSASTPGEST